MTVNAFFTSLLTWFPVIPASVLCLLPMKNQMKYGVRQTVCVISTVLILILPLVAFIETHFNTPYNAPTPFVLMIFLALYCLYLNVHFSKALSIFVLVCAIMSFLINFSITFDSYLHPYSGVNNFSFEAAVFQAVLTAAFTALISPYISKHGGLLIDSFHLHGVWYASALVSFIFLGFNLLIVPRHYSTLHVNNIFVFFLIAMPLLFFLLLLLCVLFYLIVSGMIESSRKETELRILDMQKTQFYKQQAYLEATAKERHDFKHAVRTIRSLSAEGNIEELNRFIDQYVEKMPELSVRTWCDVPTINALLNYYKQMANIRGIPLSIDITLPKDKELSETEICSILGNILENAINACREIESYKRFIRLTITVMNDIFLCIAAVNSFDGKPQMRGGKYVSTRRSGSGIGLESITSIAASMGGSADFSHEGCEFFSNIMLPL